STASELLLAADEDHGDVELDGDGVVESPGIAAEAPVSVPLAAAAQVAEGNGSGNGNGNGNGNHPVADPVRIAERIIHHYIAKRRRLPDRRSGYTQKAVIG